MKRFRSFWKEKLNKTAFFTVIVAMLIMTVALFVQPLIGMADNGDYYRSTNGQGIYKLDRYESDSYFQYFTSKFGLYQHYNESEESLPSAQNLYIQAAKFLNGLFSSEDELFDIRFLAFFQVIHLAIGLYLLVDYITWKKSIPEGIVLGAIAIFIFVDTAYTAYFNSFYTEGIVYVSFLMLAASALLLTQKRHSPYWLFFSVFINGIILIFTKQQNATEGLILLVLGLLIAFCFKIKRRHFRKIAIAGSVLMAMAGVVMYIIIPQTYVTINQFHAMSRGALMVSENPEETLEQFGINPQFSILDGSIYFERYPTADAESEQLKEEFYNKYNFVSLSTYYLTHPKELFSILEHATNNGYMIRPEVIGNYEKSAGRQPGERTEFFTLYSNLKQDLAPKTVGFVVIWMLVVSALCLKQKEKLMVVLSLIAMGLIQVGTSIVGAGDTDLAKHVFLYNVTFDVVTFICFAPILTGWLKNIHFIKKIRNKRKKVLTACLFAGIFFANPMETKASELSVNEVQAQYLIVHKVGEDVSFVSKLIEACGGSVQSVSEVNYQKEYLTGIDYAIVTTSTAQKDLQEARIKTICLGTDFQRLEQNGQIEYQNKSVILSYEQFQEDAIFVPTITTLPKSGKKEIGEIQIGEEVYPFATQLADGNYYVPYYREEGLCVFLLGAVIQEMTGNIESGRIYFVLDEVYPFSKQDSLYKMADALWKEGIPFLIRIMPVHENLDYPAFTRYVQMLRYLQEKGGTIVLHEPIVMEQQMEREPLEVKLERFQKTLEEENIFYQEFQKKPYFFSTEELLQIQSEKKEFGNVPIDVMIGVTPELKEEDFLALVENLHEKWISFADFRKDFMETTYRYQVKEVQEEFVYRETEEAAFSLFFSASDKILLVVVGISLCVLSILLIIGRIWYRRKFYR